MTGKQTTRRTMKSRAKAEPKEKEIVDIMADGIDEELDGFERDLALNQVDTRAAKNRVSTGLLALDLLLSGGTTPGSFLIFLGGEGSAKSTTAMTILNRAVVDNVQRLSYFDYEGSFDPEYFHSIGQMVGNTLDQDEIFGVRDPGTGKYSVRPKVRYFAESVAETMFDYIYRMERALPSKLYRDGAWWYVFDDKRETRSKYDGKFDKSLLKTTGKLWLPAPDDRIQALVVCDSFPAMLPRNMDEEDPGAGMAMQARMFSEQLRRIKGRMQEKRISLVGINQLREKPMTMYGSPFYEPCGQALKYFSDVRVQLSARSVQGGKGQIEEEDGIYGGTDHYAYKNIKTTKNKTATPNLEGWGRIWIKDANGQAHGFDPVYDTFFFLKELGLLTGTKNRMRINLPQMKGGEHTPISWLQLKQLVLGTNSEIKETLAKVKVEKPFHLRKACFDMFKKGKAMETYFAAKKGEVSDG